MALNGIRKLYSTTACSGGVISNLRSPSGGRVGEREREVKEGGGQGGGRRTNEVACCVVLLPLGYLYIVGGGAPYPSPKPPRVAAKGGARVAAARARAGWPPPKTVTLGLLGPRAHGALAQ
jgi:hypothetical protein